MGAIINSVAILLGGGVGLLLKGRISDRFSSSLMRVLGLCVIVIGVSSALGGDAILLVISLALGAVVGEAVDIDRALNRFGMWVQNKLKRDSSSSTFAQGFVTSTLLFCVGAMAIVGSIESGLQDDQGIIITKSIIDAAAAMLLASQLGFGVLFSAVAVLLYQGGIELFAGFFQQALTYELIAQISAVGGVMVFALGANLAFNVKIKVANLLPGFIFAVGYYHLFL